MNTDGLDLGDDKSLLLVDDDEAFLRRLAKAILVFQELISRLNDAAF